MDHLSAERVQEIAAAGPSVDIDDGNRLSPAEFEHLQQCPQCIDLLAEAVRESIRRGSKPSTEESG
jgi:hypothetical protein